MICSIPSIIALESYGGDYQSYEDAVYELYKRSFHEGHLFFRGVPIRHKKYPEYNGKPGTFWHIISDGKEESSRIPNLRRYETVAWPFYILQNCDGSCDRVLIWENERNGKRNVLLYCPDVEYLVVLSKRDGYFVFWTAYPVERAHTRRKLLKEYADYKAKAAQHGG